jgi:hypothetical protein
MPTTLDKWVEIPYKTPMTHYCAHCNRAYTPSRCIGWSSNYCQPACEKAAIEAAAKLFADWWGR